MSHQQMSRQNTTANHTETTLDQGDEAYAWLKTNHPDVHDYIRNEAPVPIDPVQTRMAVQAMGKDRAMTMLKGHVKQDTKRVWEPVVGDHWTHMVREAYQLNEALDPDITWNKHGGKATPRMREEGFHFEKEENQKKFFIDKLHAADPTPHKAYAPWLASRYASGGINKIEDFDRAHAALSTFHDAKNRKKLAAHGVNADINQYKDLPSLETEVRKIPTEMSQKEKDRVTKDTETTKIDEKHWNVVIPHTENASCLYGRGTTWCTAATSSRNYFNTYNKDGPMHILIPKNPAHEGEKYQYHAASNQFMDEHDKPVSPSAVLNSRPSNTVYEHSVDHFRNSSKSGYNRPSHAAAVILGHDFDKHKDEVINSPSSTVGTVQSVIAHRGSDEDVKTLIDNAGGKLTDDVSAGLIARDSSKYTHLMLTGPKSTVAALSQPDFSHVIKHAESGKFEPQHYEQMLSNKTLSADRKNQLASVAVKSDDPLTRSWAAAHSKEHASLLKNDPHFLVQAMAHETLSK